MTIKRPIWTTFFRISETNHLSATTSQASPVSSGPVPTSKSVSYPSIHPLPWQFEQTQKRGQGLDNHLNSPHTKEGFCFHKNKDRMAYKGNHLKYQYMSKLQIKRCCIRCSHSYVVFSNNFISNHGQTDNNTPKIQWLRIDFSVGYFEFSILNKVQYLRYFQTNSSKIQTRLILDAVLKAISSDNLKL